MDDASSATLDEIVASGRFPDAGAVLRSGLTLIVEHDQEDEELWQASVRGYGIERLRSMIDEGMAGESAEGGFDAEEVKREGRRRLAEQAG